MSHALAGRGGLTSNVADNRLLDVLFDELCRFFFSITADFTNHDDYFCIGIFLEHAQDFLIVETFDRVAAYADAGALSESFIGKSKCDFVGEGA
ncbi:MAG: hypothetical protein BWY75_03709 [bacterium ADurb.Bin425]|nr:MAG: hypothetical protein BWY75_03709 [bacterium ADurb.Bin425]